jgi:asparagine synthase (glutamine-hydrolysing)
MRVFPSLREFDFGFYLRKVLLPRADVAGMTQQVEIRPFYLDNELREFAESVPRRKLLSLFQGKKLLRKLAIKRGVIVSKKKRGFPVPFSDWIREDLHNEIHQLLAQQSQTLDRVISPDERLQLLSQHERGKVERSKAIFTLASYIVWENSGNHGHKVDA